MLVDGESRLIDGTYRGPLLLSEKHSQASFWRQANVSFLDVAALEWCKLFAEGQRGKVAYGWGEHGWRQIVTDVAAFEAALLARLGQTANQFDDHIKAMRHYRDKFVAHLDSHAVMQFSKTGE